MPHRLDKVKLDEFLGTSTERCPAVGCEGTMFEPFDDFNIVGYECSDCRLLLVVQQTCPLGTWRRALYAVGQVVEKETPG